MKLAQILNPGLFTTVQDFGRFGYESLGTPTSGAMDEFSFKVANILVGNPVNEPVLEATFLGPSIKFLKDAFISVTGANMAPVINGTKRPVWSSFHVKKGDTLSFLPINEGCRAYIAVAGGIKVRSVMGSASTYVRGKLGGISGRPLKKGDTIEVKDVNIADKKPCKVKSDYIPTFSNQTTVRVVLGPQDDYFSKYAIKKFLSSTYTLTNESDRMGFRLEGPEIKPVDNKYDIITDGLIPGSVQIPGNGKPIIMMKDAQTTGGYVKIANVISVDLPKLAQLKPKDKLRFEKVSLDRAHKLLKDFSKIISQIKEELVSYRCFDVKVNDISYDVILEES